MSGPSTLAGKLVEVHTWLRGQLADIRVEAESYLAGDGPAVGSRLTTHCLAFCDALAFHHDGEESAVLPRVVAHQPHLADAVRRLRAEHEVIGALRERVRDLVRDIDSVRPDEFRSTLADLTEELVRHLDFEEEVLIPPLSGVPWPPA